MRFANRHFGIPDSLELPYQGNKPGIALQTYFQTVWPPVYTTKAADVAEVTVSYTKPVSDRKLG
jgi:hypothetical protein